MSCSHTSVQTVTSVRLRYTRATERIEDAIAFTTIVLDVLPNDIVRPSREIRVDSVVSLRTLAFGRNWCVNDPKLIVGYHPAFNLSRYWQSASSSMISILTGTCLCPWVAHNTTARDNSSLPYLRC